MSNDTGYVLDVLATSPREINRIAERLQQPSFELLNWAAGGMILSRKNSQVLQS